MANDSSRVLVVSGRLLVAQGIRSLLEDNTGISDVEILGSLPEAMLYAVAYPPDAMVLDLPDGVDDIETLPIRVEGREVKTIVVREEEGRSFLYVHTPGMEANLQNLLAALSSDEQKSKTEDEADEMVMVDGVDEYNDRATETRVEPQVMKEATQPINFMMARASGPSSSRISASSAEL